MTLVASAVQLALGLRKYGVSARAIDRLVQSDERLAAMAAIIIGESEAIITFITDDKRLLKRVARMHDDRRYMFPVAMITKGEYYGYWVSEDRRKAVVAEALRKLDEMQLRELRAECIDYLEYIAVSRLETDGLFTQSITESVGEALAKVVLAKEHAYRLHVEALVQSLGVSLPVDSTLAEEIGKGMVHCLLRAHITDLVELTEMRPEDFKQLDGIGPKTLEVCAGILARHGLVLYE